MAFAESNPRSNEGANANENEKAPTKCGIHTDIRSPSLPWGWLGWCAWAGGGFVTPPVPHPPDTRVNVKARKQQKTSEKTIEESAKIFMNVLSNNGTSSQNNVVIANSGLAISTALGVSINEGIERAKESLISRKALESFNNLKKISGS